MNRDNLKSQMRLLAIILVFTSLFHSMASGSQSDGGKVRPEGLQCEYRTNPLGLDALQPRLSWIQKSRERGEHQSAYQILVASTLANLDSSNGDLWDSGKVVSGDSLHIPYAGQILHPGQRVYWKVRLWDGDSQAGNYSSSAWWEMGLLSPSAWKASWISRRGDSQPTEKTWEDDPAPLLRKEFNVEKKISRARVYVTGLGYYELRLNGERVGDQVLDPGWTTYSKRVLYSTYDVTTQVKHGRNALGVMLGNGWFNPVSLRMWGKLNPRDHLTIGQPRLLLQLVLTFTDGTSQTVITDESWKTSDGPLLRNDIYLGEIYDARKEQPGWDKPGFDDSTWEAARVLTNSPGQLHAQDAPPIRITLKLKPLKLTQPRPGVYIFDFGQNFAGWAQLKVKGAAGTQVRLRYGELLYPDGTLNGMTSVAGQMKSGGTNYTYDGTGFPKTAFQLDEYILKGGHEETYTPRFTFHGFRYVEVTGIPGKPNLNSLEGLRLNSDVEPTGSFTCSNEMFNRIQEMVWWTQLSNLFSVESDCPHREKFGYGGDIVAASESEILNFNMERFYAKAVQDLADAARTNGGFTETAPFVGLGDEGLGGNSGPVGWGTAHPVLQWELYQYYGDRRILAEQYDSTKRWIALLRSKASDYILDNGISDHESLTPKPRALTGTAFYFLNVKLFARIVDTLGKTNDAIQAEELADKIKAAFNIRFLRDGRYDLGTQTSQAFALHLGLVPDSDQSSALDLMLKDIEQTHQGHLSTGIFGTKYMLNALSDAGRADVAFQIVNQKTFPGWGYMLENGATTLWEHWALSDDVYSHNHPMFSSVSEWFYKWLGGIQPAPDAVGFDKIFIKPQPVGDLKWVKTSYNSVRGRIVSEWKRTDSHFTLHAGIPAGATALIFLPAQSEESVTESGRRLRDARGVNFIRMDKDRAILAVTGGTYDFQSTINQGFQSGMTKQ